MKTLRAFFVRLIAGFQRNWREQDMMEELQSHLQMHVAENIGLGMNAEEARRQALLKLGGMEATRESIRGRARFIGLETTWQDFRYAIRGLYRHTAFTGTAVFSLALGVGASLAIFTVADNLLLRPIPYRDPSQLVMLWTVNQRANIDHNSVAAGDYFDWRNQSTCFEAIAAFYDYHVILNSGRRVEEVNVQSASSELLPMLGIRPIRGRLFTREEDEASENGGNLALISYRLWQNWFAGDEGVIGRQVQINSRGWTIIGVLPPGFYFHSRAVDLWLPIGLKPAPDLRDKAGRWFWAAARLKPGVSVRQAQTQMDTIAGRLEDAYPNFDKGWTVDVEPLRDSLVGKVKASLLVLLGAVTMLLGVSCANVANLLLTRYSQRQREMAVRGALGAARWRLIRQLLTESLVLGLGGGILGLLFARWAVKALVTLAPPELTRSIEVSFDMRVVIFAFALSLLTSIIFGLAPALVGTRMDVNSALHQETRSATGMGNRLRSWLVAAEVASSVMLLAGAGLLFRTLVRLQAVDPGLNPDNILTFRVTLPNVRYPKAPNRREFFQRVTEQLKQLPGVRTASAVSDLPFNGEASGTDVTIDGRPRPRPGEDIVSIIRTVQPGYFRAMGIPVKQGRDFTDADNEESSPFRFVVSAAFVRKYLPNQEPLGSKISCDMEDKNPFGEIIGVVGDVKEGSLDKEPDPTVYYVHAHLAYSGMFFVVKTENDPLGLTASAGHVIHKIDPEQPIAEVRSMQQVIRQTFARQQFSATLLAGFSFASLMLAAVGIYGVLAYSVSQRTREIGVRVALGAGPARIMGLIVTYGVRLVFLGTAIGLAGAFTLSGLLRTLLFGISSRDPVTFVVAPLLLIAVALIASYLPARRASRLAPMEALRTE